MQEKTVARRIAALKEFSLFAGLGDKELVTVVDDLRLKEYGRDELIFRQGDESREVYLVLKGKVRIYKISPSGEETSIAIFFDHDVIGEMAADAVFSGDGRRGFSINIRHGGEFYRIGAFRETGQVRAGDATRANNAQFEFGHDEGSMRALPCAHK